MSFKNKSLTLSTSEQEFITVGAGYEASVHSVFLNNPSDNAETVTIAVWNNADQANANIYQQAVTANTFFTFEKPVNLSAGDKFKMTSTGTAVIGTISIYEQPLSGTATTISLKARGDWDNATSYEPLDMVFYSGVSWICTTAHTNSAPPSGNWMQHVAQPTLDKAGIEAVTELALVQSCYNQAADVSIGTGTHTFNYANGDQQEVTVTGDITIAFSNFPTGKACSMKIDAINWGSAAVTWPAGTLFAGGALIDLTAAGLDKLEIEKDKDDVYTVIIRAQEVA